MPKVTINGREVTVPEGTSILRAAEAAGFTVPYFCYHPGLSVPANCRMCLVEIQGARKLEPSCYTKVRDGMVVMTESPKVVTARKSVLEFILVNHPIDCPICDQAGECWLQDHYLAYDAQPSRLRTEKVAKVKVYPIGPEVVLDAERCILCTRCVRFCDEITGTHELTMVDRGDTSEIRTFPGRRLDNDYSMCTADLCPVGALTTRPFRFKRRVWLLQSTDSICTGCARNCSVHLDHYRERFERYVPRYNPDVNDHWMCDEGRLGGYELNQDRLVDIRADGTVYDHWPEALMPVARRISGQAEGGKPYRWAMLLSPQATAEGLLAARHFGDQCLGKPALFRGGKPDGKQDDFLIRADKNPNNAALDRVFDGRAVGTVAQLCEALESGEVNAVYIMGAHVPVNAETRDRLIADLQRAELVIHQSIWQGPFAALAHVTLPAASHAEQAGTFINCDGVVQRVPRAFVPLGQALPDWDIFLRVARLMRQKLPYTNADDLFGELGLQAWQPPADIPPADFHRVPHGPQRVIPGREVTPSAVVDRYKQKMPYDESLPLGEPATQEEKMP